MAAVWQGWIVFNMILKQKCYAISTSIREFMLISLFAYQQMTSKRLEKVWGRGSTIAGFQSHAIQNKSKL